MASDNPILFRGATLQDLSDLFGVRRQEVRGRIGDVPARGKFLGQETWHVRDVANRLTNFNDNDTELIDRILATHHTDLPKMLSKEYWYGQNQRLRYLRDVGELWDTSAVVALASEVFKTLRLSLMLASDAVERETGLTVKQREIIENLMHEALNEAREKLVANLAGQRANSKGKAFAPKESYTISGTEDDVDPFGPDRDADDNDDL